MSEEKTMQSDDNAVNNPSTKGSENNDVPYDRFQEVNTQKNDWKAQAEKAKAKLAEIEAKNAKAREAKMVENEEYKALIAEKDATITKLTEVKTQWDTYQEETRASLMEKLPESKREFGEGMELVKLQKYVDAEVLSNPANAGKTNSARQGVNPTGEFGGYNSPQEWATNDPKGYEAARNPLKNNGIKIAYE
jgi:predicted house-cleaning noncanonical NTP pyrophosphatase (MazG superfamily)